MIYGDITKCKKCHGSNIQVVKYIIKDGRTQYRHQCMDCGYVDVASIKFDSIPKNVEIPLLNQQLREFYYDIGDSEFNTTIYNDYIKSDEWFRKREEIFKLKGRKCYICNTSNNLDIHHLSYEFLGYEEENDFKDVIPLCRNCHKKLHDFIKEKESLIEVLKSDLIKTRNKVRLDYYFAICESVFNRIKECFKDFPGNDILLKIYLETIYGKYKCRKDIHEFFSSEKVYQKLKNEGYIQ